MFAEKLLKRLTINTESGKREYANAFDFMCDEHINSSLSGVAEINDKSGDETHCERISFKSISSLKSYFGALMTANAATTVS